MQIPNISDKLAKTLQQYLYSFFIKHDTILGLTHSRKYDF